MSSNSLENENKPRYEKPDIKGDRLNILLLCLMYVLQGTMFGLMQAIPLILQNRNVTYAEQAEFSIVTYPGCLKLLWSPVVDCVYSKKMGRRKSWVIPMQYLIGILLLLLSMNASDWLGSEDGTRKPQIRLLTVIMLLCTFFTATHDIALDGWSITMLQKRNIGHSGTCQSIGGAVGQFLAFVLFIILDSKDFSNHFRSVPQDHGFVSFDMFLFFWAIMFIVSTTLIFIFKKDNSLEIFEDEIECRLSLKESYQHLWQILKIRPIQMICLVLLTCRIGFGFTNGVAPLKLIDAGVPRDKFALLTIPSLPFQLILPFALSRYLTGPKSMRSFIVIYIFKLIFGVAFAIFIFFTPHVKAGNEALPDWYYWLLLFVYNLQTLAKFVMAIAAQAFFSRVSDPRFGGIYLTLMNTMTNAGSQWPITLCLWMVDVLTIKSCIEERAQDKIVSTCYTRFDGFYTETVLFTLCAVLWLWWGKKQIHKLEKTHPSLWIAKPKKDIVEDRLFSNTLLHIN